MSACEDRQACQHVRTYWRARRKAGVILVMIIFNILPLPHQIVIRLEQGWDAAEGQIVEVYIPVIYVSEGIEGKVRQRVGP
jgi:hypothetical protein